MSKTAVHAVGIIDDQPDIRMLLRAVLRVDQRFVLRGEASSAEEAFAALDQWQPDLLVLDESLEEGLSGMEAAPRFKTLRPEMKIVLFSAYDLQTAVDDNPSIDAFVRKDHLGSLIPAIERALSLRTR